MAGVSATTVSKLINRQKSFSPAVEARVRAAIESLDYRQNPAARSMATGQNRVVGLAVQDLRNPHFTGIIQGASQVAEAQGFGLMVVDFKEKELNAQNLLSTLALRVDGIIASSRLPDAALAQLQASRKPAVLFGQTDFHHIALTVAETGAKHALKKAETHRPDFDLYLYWFLQQQAINATRPEAGDRILAAMRRGGWPI